MFSPHSFHLPPWVEILLFLVPLLIACHFLQQRRKKAIAAGRKAALVRKTSGAVEPPEPGTVACPVCHSSFEVDRDSLGSPLLGDQVITCLQCATEFRQSSLFPAASGGTWASPPPGCRLEHLADGFAITVSVRSLVSLLVVPASLLVGGLLVSLALQGARAGNFNPLLLVGPAVLAVVIVFCLAGELRIARHGDRLTIFRGVGPIGLTYQYCWSDFSGIHEEMRGLGASTSGLELEPTIVLEGESSVLLGNMLSGKRREFVLNALRAMLAESRASATLAPPLS